MSAYRGGIREALRRRAEIVSVTEALEPTLPALHATYARRWGRISFGAMGTALAVLWPFAFLVKPELASIWLLGAAGASVGAGLAGRFGARFLSRARFQSKAVPPATGDDRLDLLRLEAADPLASHERALAGLEVPSLVLPLVAGSLLVPLLLHFLVYALWCAGTATALSLSDYGTWIGMSMIIVGHAHLALAVCSILFARRLVKMETQDIAQSGLGRDSGGAIGVATVVAAIPGLLLLAVPPILSAVTALAFVPFMYALARRSLVADRVAIEAAREQASQIRIDVTDIDRVQDALMEAPRSSAALVVEEDHELEGNERDEREPRRMSVPMH